MKSEVRIFQTTYMSLKMHSIDTIRNIHFEPSSLCNARCPVCPRYLHGGLKNKNLKEQAVSFDTFKQWFPQNLLGRLERLLFCGNYGDPMTTPDLLDIVEYILGTDIGALVINTNGGLRNEEFWTRLGKLSKNQGRGDRLTVVFAIDGLEDTNHLYRRGVEWDTLYRNINAYIKSGGKAYWSWLSFHHNQHQLDEAKQLSKDLGFVSFHTTYPYGFALEHESSGRVPSMMVLDKDGNYEYELYSVDTNENDFNKPLQGFRREINYESIDYIPQPTTNDLRDKNTELGCISVDNDEVYISADGQVHPCCYLSGFKDSPYHSYMKYQYVEILDPHYDNLNLKNNSLETILQNDFYQKKMTEGLKPGENRLAGCSNFCSKR